MQCIHPPARVLILQAAAKTNDTAGDGTTTATILSAAIIAEGMKIVAAGTNPIQLTRGIEKTVVDLVKYLKELSVEVTDDDLANVATVSAGNNEVVRSLSCLHSMLSAGKVHQHAASVVLALFSCVHAYACV